MSALQNFRRITPFLWFNPNAEEAVEFYLTIFQNSRRLDELGNPAGNYTVKATFTEPKYMNLNSHPHPYGIAIAGNDMGTAKQSYLYCEAYGDGTFIVRGFGPDAFRMNGGEPEANAAVHKAAGRGAPVTQEIALSVKGDRVDCAINGTMVASYPKAALVAPGKLKSIDGVYGIRFAHNTEVTVTGLTMTRN